MGNVCYVPQAGGEIAVIPVANPAPGVDWIYTVPAGYEMQPLLIFYRLTTSAIVATRYPMFVTYGADNYDRSRIRFSTNITAGLTRNFILALGSTRADNLYSVNYADTLPDCRYLSGDRWGSATSFLDAADQFSLIRLLVCRWRS